MRTAVSSPFQWPAAAGSGLRRRLRGLTPGRRASPAGLTTPNGILSDRAAARPGWGTAMHFQAGDPVYVWHEGALLFDYARVLGANADSTVRLALVDQPAPDERDQRTVRAGWLFHLTDAWPAPDGAPCAHCQAAEAAVIGAYARCQDAQRATVPAQVLATFDAVNNQRFGCGHGQLVELPAELPGLPAPVADLLGPFARPSDCPEAPFFVAGLPHEVFAAMYAAAPELFRSSDYSEPPPELVLSAMAAVPDLVVDDDLFVLEDLSWQVVLAQARITRPVDDS